MSVYPQKPFLIQTRVTKANVIGNAGSVNPGNLFEYLSESADSIVNLWLGLLNISHTTTVMFVSELLMNYSLNFLRLTLIFSNGLD